LEDLVAQKYVILGFASAQVLANIRGFNDFDLDRVGSRGNTFS